MVGSAYPPLLRIQSIEFGAKLAYWFAHLQPLSLLFIMKSPFSKQGHAVSDSQHDLFHTMIVLNSVVESVNGMVRSFLGIQNSATP